MLAESGFFVKFLEGQLDKVLGAAVLAVGVYFWTKFGKPLLQGKIFRVPNVAGRWVSAPCVDSDAVDHQSTLTLSQTGASIRATLQRTEDKSVREFHYDGQLTSNQLVLTFREKDAEGMNVGAMVLKLSSDKQVLRGQTVFLHHDKGEVVAKERCYRKAMPS